MAWLLMFRAVFRCCFRSVKIIQLIPNRLCVYSVFEARKCAKQKIFRA